MAIDRREFVLITTAAACSTLISPAEPCGAIENEAPLLDGPAWIGGDPSRFCADGRGLGGSSFEEAMDNAFTKRLPAGERERYLLGLEDVDHA